MALEGSTPTALASVPDPEPAEPSSTADAHAGSTVTSWSERLAELAHLASASTEVRHEEDEATLRHEEDEATQSIHFNLDAIESILRDPRPALSREVAKCRPDGRAHGRSAVEDRARARSPSLSPATDKHCNGSHENGFDKTEMLARLSTVLTEVNGLHGQLGDRRKETGEICDLYEERCRGLERTVAELGLEVAEL
jgi:hypothetical protein